jgi:hypothetical protein
VGYVTVGCKLWNPEDMGKIDGVLLIMNGIALG